MIDLRSDIVAPATPEMLAAMAGATVGVAMWGDDPSVAQLEQRGAERLGTEACLLLPNATTASLVALLAQVERGSAVALDAISHINVVESYGVTELCGASLVPVPSARGHLAQDALAGVLSDGGRDGPRVSVVVLEDTHTFAGGVAIGPDELRTLADLAHAHGASVHLDGARLFNASVALGIPVAELTAGLDTVAVSLSKGLCAPMGGLLAGRAAVIDRARTIALHTGLARIHKAGYFAAAALIALDTMVDRLVDDHRRARTLAEAIAGIDGVTVDLSSVQTNLVIARLEPRFGPADAVAGQLAGEGLRMLSYPGGHIRAVTHRGIDDADVDSAIRILRRVLA